MYALKENEEVTSGQTTLEEAIDVLDYIAHAFTRLEVAELKELQLCLRRYAVIAPLRKDNRNTAKVCRLVTVLFTVHALFVYSRLWFTRRSPSKHQCTLLMIAVWYPAYIVAVR